MTTSSQSNGHVNTKAHAHANAHTTQPSTMKTTKPSPTTQTSHTSHASHSATKSHATPSQGTETMTTTSDPSATSPTATTAASPAPAATPARPAIAPAPNVLTDAQVQEILSELDVIAGILGPLAVPLTIAERKQELRMKVGGGWYVPKVLDLAERYGVVLPGISAAAAEADLAYAEALAPIAARLQALVTLVGDAVLQANSRAWQAGTMAYSTLVRLVSKYPALQTELAPMASFLAITYKDAPTSLRKKGAKQLETARAARKEKKAAASGATAPSPAASSEPVAVAAAPPVKPVAGG